MSTSRTIVLRCGTLEVSVARAEMSLDDLCGFASRRSRKRGFVFVSKVLGKHYPVRPRLMTLVQARLAESLGALPGPVVLIGMAETATGLAQGVYESWLCRTGREDGLFLHTTRYHLDRPLALTFDESHSHATEHLLYEPADPEAVHLFRTARALVLVDDEISTGRTLANLAAAYRRLNPNLDVVHCVCLTDWLEPEARSELVQRTGLATVFHSLLQGSFRLQEDTTFAPGPIPDVTGAGDFKDGLLPRNTGRLGVRGLMQCDLDGLIRAAGVRPGQRLLVLGSGEFSYPPFLLARRLEERGWDVHFQSTTRSPLLVGNDITSTLEFVDNYHDGIPNYLYNAADRNYDGVLVGYETRPLPAAHTLPRMLGAIPIFF